MAVRSLRTYSTPCSCAPAAAELLALQVCLLDLDYNLPVQVRDSATGKELEDLPESDVNKEYVLNRLAQDGDLDSSYNKQRANDTILKLQRTTPYYKVCTYASAVNDDPPRPILACVQ